MTTLSASDVAARRIREARKKRGWRVKDLADACEKAGAADITAAVITNLETRRRPGREITADEVLKLAWVLGIPPLQLLSPVSEDEALRIVPGEDRAPLDAVAWLTDDDAALASVWQVRNPSSGQPPALRQGSSPLTVLRQVRSVTRALRGHDRALADEKYRGYTGQSVNWHRNSLTVMALRLLQLLAALEAFGYPPLEPPELEIVARYDLPVTLAEWDAAAASAEGGEPSGTGA